MTPAADRAVLDLRFAVKALAAEGTFEGYASVFGAVDRVGDAVARGAFRRSLARRPARQVKMLWQHDPREPIGVWEALAEDDHGLRVRGRLLLAVRRAAEAHALLKAGVIDGLSIGYTTVEASAGAGARTLTDLDLWEISLVTFQACPGAAVSAVKGANDDAATLVASLRRAAAVLTG